mgnify:FL=1
MSSLLKRITNTAALAAILLSVAPSIKAQDLETERKRAAIQFNIQMINPLTGNNGVLMEVEDARIEFSQSFGIAGKAYITSSGDETNFKSLKIPSSSMWAELQAYYQRGNLRVFTGGIVEYIPQRVNTSNFHPWVGLSYTQEISGIHVTPIISNLHTGLKLSSGPSNTIELFAQGEHYFNRGTFYELGLNLNLGNENPKDIVLNLEYRISSRDYRHSAIFFGGGGNF